ncbi:MAG: class D sortase [Ruminococcus sp.]|nr:class D sortase [Ruminococcus sp.]
MSDRQSVKHSRSRHRKHSESNKVLRTVTYVLTPFLVLAVVCGVFVLGLLKPYNDFKPYLNLVFNEENKQTQGDKQVSIYHADDAPLRIREVTNEETEETHTMIYPYYGDYYGSFTCENAGMKDIPIYAGTRLDVLEKGIGWYNGSVYIGNVGNLVLAGHNHTYFYNLPRCKEGDIVVIETDYVKMTYIISEIVTFDENDSTYIDPTFGHDRLTAYTCWNNGRLGMSKTRIAILGDLVERQWKKVEVAK